VVSYIWSLYLKRLKNSRQFYKDEGQYEELLKTPLPTTDEEYRKLCLLFREMVILRNEESIKDYHKKDSNPLTAEEVKKIRQELGDKSILFIDYTNKGPNANDLPHLSKIAIFRNGSCDPSL